MPQVRPIAPRIYCIEDALQKTGWGIYYKFLVGFAAACALTNGIACLSMHFALPLSICDTALSEDNITSTHIAFIIGRAIGGFFLSSISDNTGKKCMIPKTLMVIFGSCFVAAFSHNAYTLYLAAFFLGSGLQANSIVVKIYLSEILPAKRRGFYMVFTDLFWTLGYFTTCIFTYFVLDTRVIEHHGMDMRLTSWRVIFAVAGGVGITMACASALLEMSPRYLLFKKRVITASLVLKQFYAINQSKYGETFDLHSQNLYNLIADFEMNKDPEPTGSIQYFCVLFKVMFRMIRMLFKRRFVLLVAAIGVVKLPFLFGIAGMNIFLAKSFTFDNNSRVEGGDFLHIAHVKYGRNCTVGIDSSLYGNFFLVSVNVFVGQIVLMVLIDRIGRKVLLVLALSTCGIVSLFLAYTKSFYLMVISSSIFTIGYTMIESALCVVLAESFPTAIRGTAAGQSQFYSFLLACILYKFLNVSCWHFFMVMGGVFLGTTLVAYFIPEYRNRPMLE